MTMLSSITRRLLSKLANQATKLRGLIQTLFKISTTFCNYQKLGERERERMEGENTVTLHGMRKSPYSFTVEMALKIKGIPYKFVEEDLKNKSELLLKYNPVHKKIPILVHNGNPILESLVIVEYIDETWKDNGPRLSAQDPYTRAQVRFWTSFVQQKLFVAMLQVLITEGEAQEKAIKEAIDTLKVVEEGMLEFFPTTPITNENQLGFLDIVMCSVLGSYKAFEEVIGAKLIDPERNPLVFSRMEAMLELPGVKEARLTHEKTVALFQFLRGNLKEVPKA